MQTINQIKNAISHLDAENRRQLMSMLNRNVKTGKQHTSGLPSRDSTAWSRYRAAGKRLATTSKTGEPALTDAVQNLRY